METTTQTVETITRKVTLRTASGNGGAFRCYPAGEWQLDPDTVLCNDVTLSWERHPHNMRLWVIGHEFGAVCAVWATHESEALDVATDAYMLDCLLVSEEDFESLTEEEQDACARLGNAGEPANLEYAWIRPVYFSAAVDCVLLCRFAEARGACNDTLDA